MTYLNKLNRLLDSEKRKYYFSCIRDLVENGLDQGKFPEQSSMPTRQDITQYLASWCKYVGISAQECRDWMLEYCCEVLSVLSSSSRSQIRHSTKSNIKYIYNSDVKFECSCEENPFRAACDYECPVYLQMKKALQERKRQDEIRLAELDKKNEFTKEVWIPSRKSIKENYREQFQKAIALAHEKLDQGYSRREIANLLKEQGYKTITGKEWNQSNLTNELNKRNKQNN